MTPGEQLDISGGLVCRACGGPKDARFAFCRDCYYSLTPELRRNLWRPVDRGFGEAYAQAEQLLKRTRTKGAKI